jgi:hypothetical protein
MKEAGDVMKVLKMTSATRHSDQLLSHLARSKRARKDNLSSFLWTDSPVSTYDIFARELSTTNTAEAIYMR